MPTPLVTLDSICKSFGSLQILKEITLSIHQGEITSIVGPSGAGKTTLLQIIGTLLSWNLDVSDYVPSGMPLTFD